MFWERHLELRDTIDLMGVETVSGHLFYDYTPEFLSMCAGTEMARFLGTLLMRHKDLPSFYETLAQVSSGRDPEIVDDLLGIMPVEDWRGKLLRIECAMLPATPLFKIRRGPSFEKVYWLRLLDDGYDFSSAKIPIRNIAVPHQEPYTISGLAITGPKVPPGLYRVHGHYNGRAFTTPEARHRAAVLLRLAQHLGYTGTHDEMLQQMLQPIMSVEPTYGSWDTATDYPWVGLFRLVAKQGLRLLIATPSEVVHMAGGAMQTAPPLWLTIQNGTPWFCHLTSARPLRLQELVKTEAAQNIDDASSITSHVSHTAEQHRLFIENMLQGNMGGFGRSFTTAARVAVRRLAALSGENNIFEGPLTAPPASVAQASHQQAPPPPAAPPQQESDDDALLGAALSAHSILTDAIVPVVRYDGLRASCAEYSDAAAPHYSETQGWDGAGHIRSRIQDRLLSANPRFEAYLTLLGIYKMRQVLPRWAEQLAVGHDVSLIQRFVTDDGMAGACPTRPFEETWSWAICPVVWQAIINLRLNLPHGVTEPTVAQKAFLESTVLGQSLVFEAAVALTQQGSPLPFLVTRQGLMGSPLGFRVRGIRCHSEDVLSSHLFDGEVIRSVRSVRELLCITTNGQNCAQEVLRLAAASIGASAIFETMAAEIEHATIPEAGMPLSDLLAFAKTLGEKSRTDIYAVDVTVTPCAPTLLTATEEDKGVLIVYDAFHAGLCSHILPLNDYTLMLPRLWPLGKAVEMRQTAYTLEAPSAELLAQGDFVISWTKSFESIEEAATYVLSMAAEVTPHTMVVNAAIERPDTLARCMLPGLHSAGFRGDCQACLWAQRLVNLTGTCLVLQTMKHEAKLVIPDEHAILNMSAIPALCVEQGRVRVGVVSSFTQPTKGLLVYHSGTTMVGPTYGPSGYHLNSATANRLAFDTIKKVTSGLLSGAMPDKRDVLLEHAGVLLSEHLEHGYEFLYARMGQYTRMGYSSHRHQAGLPSQPISLHHDHDSIIRRCGNQSTPPGRAHQYLVSWQTHIRYRICR